MDTITKKRLVFAVLLAVSFIADLFSFLFSRWKVLESNPIYVFSGSLLFMIGLKIAINTYLVYRIFKLKPHKNPKHYAFISYYHIVLVVILTIGQFLGAYSNITATVAHDQQFNEKIYAEQQLSPTELLTEAKIAEIEQEYTENITLDDEELVRRYVWAVSVVMLYPLALCFITFIAWMHIGDFDKKEADGDVLRWKLK